jgi:hypothetical protein
MTFKGDVYVKAFLASGVNDTEKPFQTVKVYIRSDATNKILAVNFDLDGEHVATDQTYGVPAHAHFNLVSEPVSAEIASRYPGQPCQSG